MGNILMPNKKRFVFVDFERSTTQQAFIDPGERELLCFLDKLYVFRFFFRITASTSIKSHKAVHDLFVNYFEDELQVLRVDDDWTARFGTILRANSAEVEDYNAFISAKEIALYNIFHTELFQHKNKSYVFHQYLLQRRFKTLVM